MDSGCGTFASSSPFEGNMDYSHQMNMSILVEKEIGNSAFTNCTCSIWYIGIGRRWGPVQPTNYVGMVGSDVTINIKGGATK